MKPKGLNKKARVIFQKLTKDLTAGTGRRIGGKIGDPNNTYMPVSVEAIGDVNGWPMFSVTHYGLQNGDLMSDPDVIFLKMSDMFICPMTYRNDYMGVNKEEMWVEDGKVFFKKQQQRDLVDFCNQWMENIQQQQDI